MGEGSAKPFVVAGIPAYNCEGTIAKVVLGSMRHVDKVVVVDDGSQDMTGEIAERLGAVVIRHPRNMGKGEALRSLLKAARALGADVLVTIDADAQYDPTEIPKLAKPVLEGAVDVAVGSRYAAKGLADEVPAYRKLGLKAIDALVRGIGGLEIRDTQSGFRAYGRRAIWTLLPAERDMGADSELLMKGAEEGLSMAEVPVSVRYRGLKRTSTHHPVYHALQVMAGAFKFASIRHPLIFFGTPGLLAVGLGVLFGWRAAELYIAYSYLSVGFTLLAVFFILGGLLLLFTAIILFTLVSVLREER